MVTPSYNRIDQPVSRLKSSGVAHLNDDNISRNKVAGLNLALLTITENSRLESNIGLELGNNISGLLFLVPSDEGVLYRRISDISIVG